jgi:hypothetical protein
MLTEEIKSAFRRLIELREERDETKTAAEAAENAYRRFEQELWDRMTEDGTLQMKDASLKVPLGPPHGTITFSPRETKFGRVLNYEKALEHFEQRAMVDEMMKSKVSKARLNEYVRQILEDENAVMPPGIDFYVTKGITITRPKS